MTEHVGAKGTSKGRSENVQSTPGMPHHAGRGRIAVSAFSDLAGIAKVNYWNATLRRMAGRFDSDIDQSLRVA